MFFNKIVDIPDMAKMSVEDKDGFTLARRKGFGASDSSILLGVNKWTTLNSLLEQKNSDVITDEERAIGEKPQVRMGADLEPLILDKFAKQWDVSVYKPSPQYRLDGAPHLTVNYDGICVELDCPVEAKCVSLFADKHWGWDNALTSLSDHPIQKYGSATSLMDKIETQAAMIGIPPYYYTQVQQQLLGMESDFAFLAAMRVKEWKVYTFRIDEDEEVQLAIINKAIELGDQCKYFVK